MFTPISRSSPRKAIYKKHKSAIITCLISYLRAEQNSVTIISFHLKINNHLVSTILQILILNVPIFCFKKYTIIPCNQLHRFFLRVPIIQFIQNWINTRKTNFVSIVKFWRQIFYKLNKLESLHLRTHLRFRACAVW